MKRYYSPTTKGFYIEDIQYTSMPRDIIEITEGQHHEMLRQINTNSKVVSIIGESIVYEDAPVIVTWDSVRSKRARLLTKSDYTQMPDWPGDKTAWAVYRQQLRDLPQIYTNAANVVFPISPGA